MTAKVDDLDEIDEAALAAALLDLLDRDDPAVAGIVAGLPRLTSPAGIICNVIREAVAGGQTPTRLDIWNRALVDDPIGEIRSTFVEAMANVVATGRRSADVARRAAGRIAARHNEAALADALAAAAAAPGDAGRWNDAVAARARLEAGSAAGEKLQTALDYINEWSIHEAAPVVATGFSWFDDATGGGLPVGGIVAFFAPPKSAKSTIALQLTTGAILSDPTLTAVWARGEMTPAEIGERLVVMGSRLVDDCQPCTMTDSRERTARARAASARVAAAIGDRLKFVDSPLQMPAIESAVVASGARLVVIDYYQLIQPPAGGTDRVSDMDRIAGQIRDMAVRHDLAVIVISSMASGTTSASHLGQLGRWGAEIGFACSIGYAAEIERDSKGNPVKDPDGTYRAVWRCAGARSVEAQDLVLRFDGQRMTFKEDSPEGAYPEFSAAALGGAT